MLARVDFKIVCIKRDTSIDMFTIKFFGTFMLPVWKNIIGKKINDGALSSKAEHF